MTPRLWSVLTTVAVVVAGAAASPAAAAPPPVPAAPATSSIATAPPAEGPQTTVTGELRRLVVADREGQRTTVSAVVTADGDAVQVRTTDVSDVPVGSTVAVSVAAADVDVDALDLDGGAVISDVQVLAASPTADRIAEAPAGPAPREVHLMSALLPWQAPAVIDLAPVNAAVTNASTYFSTSTGGKVSLDVTSQRNAGTFTGWGTADTCTIDQAFGLLDWAGLQAGIFPAHGSGKHVIVQTPYQGACSLGVIMDIDDGGGIWINGFTGAGELGEWDVAQALGHTMGLGSSHARTNCQGLVDGPWYECQDAYHGSAYDVMGLVLPPAGSQHLGAPGPLNGAQLEILGVLDTTNAIWAIGPGTNTLQPVGGLTGVRFLRIAGVSDAAYYVELRAAVGPDADLGTTRRGCLDGTYYCTSAVFQPGVIIHRVDDDARIGTETFLVEAAAKTPRQRTDPAPFVLAPGRSIVVEGGEFEISLAPTSPAGTATVTVKRGPGAAVHTPFGNFESVSATPGSVSLRGWALDRDTRLPSYLWVSVGGTGQVVRANAPRPDIARYYPEQGSSHGFDLKLNAGPGSHSVCVTVLNSGPGTNASLGCRTATVPAGGSPVGVLESVTTVPGGVTFTGWALDPDTLASSYVLVEAPGQSTYALANQPRPDVAKFFPTYGPARGFSTTLTTLPGTQRVCATAVNVGTGTHTSLGCRTVTVTDASPFGQLESGYVLGGKFHFKGWAVDPDVTGPVTMWIDVDGQGVLTVPANQYRPDVGAALPQAGPNRGFTGVANVPAGARNVCVWAINNARGTNTSFGCRPAR